MFFFHCRNIGTEYRGDFVKRNILVILDQIFSEYWFKYSVKIAVISDATWVGSIIDLTSEMFTSGRGSENLRTHGNSIHAVAIL